MQNKQLVTDNHYLRLAEMQDVQQAMRRLSALPTRGLPDGLSESEKADLRRAQMENVFSALKGVSAYALNEAVERVMQNALGHKFMPEPPELRGLCDQIMRPILEARARDAQDKRIREEMKADQSRAKWTPESRARATAKWEAAKAQQRLDSAAEDTRHDHYDTSVEASMARLKQAAEANGNEFDLNGLRSAPIGSFKQIGRAA